MVSNNTFTAKHKLVLQVKVYDINGKNSLLTQVPLEIYRHMLKGIFLHKKYIRKPGKR